MESRHLKAGALVATGASVIAYFAIPEFKEFVDSFFTADVPEPMLPSDTISAANSVIAESSVEAPTLLATYDAQESVAYLTSLDADATRMIAKIDVLLAQLDALKPVDAAEAQHIAAIKANLLQFRAENVAVQEDIRGFLNRGTDPQYRAAIIQDIYNRLFLAQGGYSQWQSLYADQSTQYTKYGVDKVARAVLGLRG